MTPSHSGRSTRRDFDLGRPHVAPAGAREAKFTDETCGGVELRTIYFRAACAAAMKPVSRSRWDGGCGTDSGPSRGDPHRLAFPPDKAVQGRGPLRPRYVGACLSALFVVPVPQGCPQEALTPIIASRVTNLLAALSSHPFRARWAPRRREIAHVSSRWCRSRTVTSSGISVPILRERSPRLAYHSGTVGAALAPSPSEHPQRPARLSRSAGLRQPTLCVSFVFDDDRTCRVRGLGRRRRRPRRRRKATSSYLGINPRLGDDASP